MAPKRDPEWEVVDELPGEKNRAPQRRGLTTLLKNKTLWFGLMAGALVVLLFPVVRVLVLNLVRAWWLWLGIALYWIYRRMQRNSAQSTQKPPRR